MAERKDRSLSQAVLHKSQTETFNNLNKLLETSQPTLIIIEGASGVGKSTVLDNLQTSSINQRFSMFDMSDLTYKSSRAEKIQTSGSVVVTALPCEAPKVEELISEYPGMKTAHLKVMAMDEEETEKFTTSIRTDKTTLQAEDIVKYSLGVPYLVEKLSMPGISKDMAVNIAAEYVYTDWHIGKVNGIKESSLKSYLVMQIPDDVEDLSHIVSSYIGESGIYSSLYRTLSKQDELKAEGIFEEDPLFIAPESEAIYNAMIKHYGDTRIDIFIPELSDEDFARFLEAFGFGSTSRAPFDSRAGSRSRMFGEDYRKVEFLFNPPEELEDDFSYEDRGFPNPILRETLKEYVEGFRNLELPLIPQSRGSSSFLIHSHEHEGMGVKQAKIGWMVESLLQQRGIPYFVKNGTYEKDYIYDPQTKHIEEVSFELRRDW